LPPDRRVSTRATAPISESPSASTSPDRRPCSPARRCLRDGRHLLDLRRTDHVAATGLTSNGDPSEQLVPMADPLRAQSAIDRSKSTAQQLVRVGESYCQNITRPNKSAYQRLPFRTGTGTLNKPTGCRDHDTSRLLWARVVPRDGQAKSKTKLDLRSHFRGTLRKPKTGPSWQSTKEVAFFRRSLSCVCVNEGANYTGSGFVDTTCPKLVRTKGL
jgi:hypothetical protein